MTAALQSVLCTTDSPSDALLTCLSIVTSLADAAVEVVKARAAQQQGTLLLASRSFGELTCSTFRALPARLFNCTSRLTAASSRVDALARLRAKARVCVAIFVVCKAHSIFRALPRSHQAARVQWLPRYPALQTVSQPSDSLLPAETADTGALTFLPLPSAAAAASDDAHALCELSALISRANAQHAALARRAHGHNIIIASAPATDLQRQSRRSNFALRNLPWPHRVSAVRQPGPATATYHFDSASSNSLFSIQPSSLYDGGITSYSFRPPQRAPPPLADAIPSALPELPDVVIVVPKTGTPQQPHTVERQPQSETPLSPPPPVLSAAMELHQKVESRDFSDLSGDGGREALLADLVSDNPMARLKRRTVEPAAIISAESPKAAAITNTLPAPSTGGDSGDAHTTLMAAILAGPAKLRPPRPRAPSATSELRKQPQPPREALLDSIRAAGGRAKSSLQQQQPATASTTSGESEATGPHDVMAALSASLARRRASVAAPQGVCGSDEDW